MGPAARAGPPQGGRAAHGAPPGVRKENNPEEHGSWLKARVWLAPRFPLNVQHMLLVLEVLAAVNKSLTLHPPPSTLHPHPHPHP